MREDTTIPFVSPAFRDELSDLLREGAQRIIRQAVEAELGAFLEEHAADHDPQGRRAVVRNGYLPSREVLTGVGPVEVRVPRTRDRSGSGRCFRSELLPPYLKKTNRVEAVIPWLYLKGVSTNDFGEALRALFGESVEGLSPASITRLKEGWDREYAEWRNRAWHGEEFVYLWADGIYVNVRDGERRCLLVVVGCDARGRKRFLALESGYRLVWYKKRRIDEISQFAKRAQGDSRDVANLEQGRIGPGHPLRDMHLRSVRMPDDQHPLPKHLSTPKTSHATTRQRVEAAMNPHPIVITGSV